MTHFPLFLTLRKKPILVVGGGELAARKIRLLLKYSSNIHVIADDLCDELVKKEKSGHIEWTPSRYPKEINSDFAFVVSATNNDHIDLKISAMAHKANVPINVVDKPNLSDFIFPAIIDRSPIMVAVSSSGASPVLARRIRGQIEVTLPANIGQLAQLAKNFRNTVKTLLPKEINRKIFWENYFDGISAKRFLTGDQSKAQEALFKAVNDTSFQDKPIGRVQLVGAGPGDPDLLTMRAFRALQNADLIVSDRLVDERILDLARRDAERLYVGKEKGKHTIHQSLINRVIANAAEDGQTVVRLKGGDPFIFGRGGEEMEYLKRRNIEVEIIPGITAATGAAAAANFPLTHRDLASSVTFVTGHIKENGLDIDWDHLATKRQTLVFYMGIENAGIITGKLLKAGLPARTLAAIIENATRQNQRVLKTNLAALEATILRHRVKSPSLLVIGDVTKFATEQLTTDINSTSETPHLTQAI